MTGTIPTEMGLLTELTVLDLGEHQFSGVLYLVVVKSASQIVCDFHFSIADQNMLTGPIPSEMGQMTQMWLLYLCKSYHPMTVSSCLCFGLLLMPDLNLCYRGDCFYLQFKIN